LHPKRAKIRGSGHSILQPLNERRLCLLRVRSAVSSRPG
jgi:hypothetical protein